MKIAIVATNGPSLINFRGKLIQEWLKFGHEVVCISIETREEIESEITELGASYYQVAGDRTGINILRNAKMIYAYKKAFDKIKPDLCFLYMSKPVAFGGLAAIKSKVPRIVVFVTGLEIAFYSGGIRNAGIRLILKILFKKVHKHCEKVFFESHADQEKMLKWKLVKKEQIAYVDGSGVDMTWFEKKPIPNDPVVLMIARLVWSKGIKEYIDAAKIVKVKYPSVRFLLVGGIDENDEALSQKMLNDLVQRKSIEYYGFTKDIRPYLETCSIFVLPSYHEGKGKCILEAQAVGRPVITTNAPGCGETVIDGYNGFLVPIKDGLTLSEKIMELVENPELRKIMGENAYEFCKNNFDVNIINDVFLKELGMK